MPELPEVEAQRVLMERMVVGKKIVKVIAIEQGGAARDGTFDEKVIRGIDRIGFERSLTNRRIVSSSRKGKQLYLELEAPVGALFIHFMMTGALLVQGEPVPSYEKSKFDISSWPPKFCKFELVAEDGTRIAFVDTRRFARVSICETADYVKLPPLSELAPDPLFECPDLQVFIDALGRRSAPIKAVLLDQKALVSGIGNWLADDVLYQSGIHPSSPASALPSDSVSALRQALIHIVTTACAVDARSNKFPQAWLFHHRWANLTSGSIDSPLGRIHFDTIAGRTTAFLPSKQRKFASTSSSSKHTAAPKKRKKNELSQKASSLSNSKLVVASAALLSTPISTRTSSRLARKKQRSSPHFELY